MQKKLIFSILFVLLILFSSAQDSDKNIIIEQANEEYRFVKGTKENPVQVKQVLETAYRCNNFRVKFLVSEFYNKQIEINDADLWIDGDKVRGSSLDTSFYSVDGIFYSDAKVCNFNLQFEKKGSINKLRIEKTVLDPRYFCNIFFTGA